MITQTKVFFALLIALGAIFLFLPKEVLAQVVINELLPDPSGDENVEEWVELYNTEETSIDVVGYRLKDAGNHELEIGTDYTGGNTLIAGKSWLLVRRNNHPNFSLNNSGEEIISLWNNASPSAQIDVFSYSGSAKNKSWGRIPDGEDISEEKLDPTPGTANPVPTQEPEPEETPEPEPEDAPESTETLPTSTPTPEGESSPRAVELVATLAGEVLGEESTPGGIYLLEPSPSPEASGEAITNNKTLPVIFLGAGLVFFVAAGLSLWYTKWRCPG